jgi:hypothetical protein
MSKRFSSVSQIIDFLRQGTRARTPSGRRNCLIECPGLGPGLAATGDRVPGGPSAPGVAAPVLKLQRPRIKTSVFFTLANTKRFQNSFKTPFIDVLRYFGMFCLSHETRVQTFESAIAWTLSHIGRSDSFKTSIGWASALCPMKLWHFLLDFSRINFGFRLQALGKLS